MSAESPEFEYTGSAYGSDPNHHRIEGGEFVCSAPAEAKCRTSPTCECENWCCCDDVGESHDEGDHCCTATLKPGQACWMSGWVGTSGVEDSHADIGTLEYDDDGVVLPDGPVACDWDDGIWWSYAQVRSSPGQASS